MMDSVLFAGVIALLFFLGGFFGWEQRGKFEEDTILPFAADRPKLIRKRILPLMLMSLMVGVCTMTGWWWSSISAL